MSMNRQRNDGSRDKCWVCGKPLQWRAGVFCSGDCRREFRLYRGLDVESEADTPEAVHEAATVEAA